MKGKTGETTTPTLKDKEVIWEVIYEGLQMIIQKRLGQQESNKVQQEIDLLMAEVQKNLKDPATADTYFLTQLLPAL